MPNYTREVVRSFETGPAPRLDVRTTNGSVTVRGEDRQDVAIHAWARFRAPDDEAAEELVAAIEQGIYHEEDRVNAHAPDSEGDAPLFGVLRHMTAHRTRLELDFDIAAPRGCSLSLRMVNGSLEVREVGRDVKGHIVNGRYELSDLGGDLSMQYVNARGTLRRIAGSVDLSYTNGDLDVEGVGGSFDLHLVNGRVDIRNAAGKVSARGVSGSYSLTSAIRDDVTMSNAHGRIVLAVPSDSRFKLDATSSLGSVTSELDVRERGAGHGEAPSVTLRSETGSIELRTKRERTTAGV
jgi:hypothetical protein